MHIPKVIVVCAAVLLVATVLVGGALLVGATWSVLGGGRPGVRGAVLAGLGGSLVDSFLGATIQAVGELDA